ADVREVDADLVRAPGPELDARQVGVSEARDDAHVRDGMAPAREHRHALAILRMPRDRRLDVHRAVGEMAPRERRVHALHLAPLDHAREPAVRQLGLSDQQQSRRAALQPGGGTQGPPVARDVLGGDDAGGDGTGQGELIGEEAVETLGLGSDDAEGDGGHQGPAALASFARSCARPSSHSDTASAIAPTVMAESATLKVGQRVLPIPTSTKSTTPRALRTRSITLPTAPAHTSASATIRKRSP